MSDEQINDEQTLDTVVAAEGADAEAVKPQETTDTEVQPAEAASETQTDETSVEDAPSETEDSNDEPAAVVDQWAGALQESDPERFAKMTQQFASNEPFSEEDIAWVSEINKSPSLEATKYVLELQRSEFQAQQKVDTSVADAEAIVGNLDTLIDFAKANAPADKVAEWQTIVNFAHRTGDDAMMLGALKEMKAFRDSIPGNKPKTLGHLAATQVNTQPPAPKEAPKPATDEKPAPDRFGHLSSLSSQALATIVMNGSADPAARAAADAELTKRGI